MRFFLTIPKAFQYFQDVIHLTTFVFINSN